MRNVMEVFYPFTERDFLSGIGYIHSHEMFLNRPYICALIPGFITQLNNIVITENKELGNTRN